MGPVERGPPPYPLRHCHELRPWFTVPNSAPTTQPDHVPWSTCRPRANSRARCTCSETSRLLANHRNVLIPRKGVLGRQTLFPTELRSPARFWKICGSPDDYLLRVEPCGAGTLPNRRIPSSSRSRNRVAKSGVPAQSAASRVSRGGAGALSGTRRNMPFCMFRRWKETLT